MPNKQHEKLKIEDFENMSSDEQNRLIEQTFHNYYNAQVSYLNNIVIKRFSNVH